MLNLIVELQHREISLKNQIAFGIMSMIFYFQPYISWIAPEKYTYSISILETVASCICCLFVVLTQYYGKNSKNPIIAVFWYLTILYCLPFLSIFSLFISKFDDFWLFHSIFCSLTLSLITSWITFITLNFVGLLLAYLAYFICTNQIDITVLNNNGTLMLYHYVLNIIICYLLLYTKDRNISLLVKIKEKLSAINNQLQNKISKQTAYLKTSLQAKESFLNNISHEIRAPMQGIYGVAKELEEDWHKIPEDKKFAHVQLIIKSSDRLIALFCDLLELSKLSAKQLSMNFEMSDLQKITQNVVQDLESLSFSKGIPVSFFHDPNLDSVTNLDKVRIAQVLRNLISNAIKYSNDGEILITIECLEKKSTDNKSLMVKIKDSGIGIPTKELNTVFLPFVQSSKTKNSSGGTGLGLSICSEIINLHKGKIWAINNLEGGSSFFFTIPIIKKDAPPKKNLKSIEEVIQNINDKGYTLILDDDYLAIESGKIILSSMGLKVLTAVNTEECLEKLQNNKVSILFLDMMMIDMSGLEFLKILNKNPDYSHIKVIIVSGTHDKNEIEKALKLGAITHFNKPYHKSQMSEAIVNLFQF
jgi:hypothetical protein